jgi:hypothetical protein
MATPAIADGVLYLRSMKHVIAIAPGPPKPGAKLPAAGPGAPKPGASVPAEAGGR